MRESSSALRALDGVEVVEAGPASKVLDLLDGVDAVVLVDAVRTSDGGRQPGELVRAEAGPSGLPAAIGSSLSSHGFGVADAVALAAALGRMPRVVFFGVEAAGVTMGQRLSPEVENALPQLVARIVEEAAALAGDREP